MSPREVNILLYVRTIPIRTSEGDVLAGSCLGHPISNNCGGKGTLCPEVVHNFVLTKARSELRIDVLNIILASSMDC